MTLRTDRVNRVLLGIVGVLLTLAATGGLLVGLSVFGGHRAKRSVIYPPAARLIDREQGWLWWVIGAVALVVAVAALYWLILQPRVERLAAVPLESSLQGDSAILGPAVAAAVRTEAAALSGVERARARLVGNADDPQLLLAVWMQEGADLRAVRRQLDERVLGHARDTLGRASLRTRLRIEMDSGARQRVR